MIKDLSVLDRLTQRITREGTSVFIRTYDGAAVVHEHELTNYPSGPIPDEVSTVAEAIRAGLATGGTLSTEQLAHPDITGVVASTESGDLVGPDGAVISSNISSYYKFFLPCTQFIGSGNAKDKSLNSADASLMSALTDAAAWANPGYVTTESGNNLGLSIPAGKIKFNLATDSIIFSAVVKKSAPATSQNIFGCGDGVSSQGFYISMRASVGGVSKIRPVINSSGGVVNGLSDSTATFGEATATDHVLTMVIDAVTKSIFLYCDGALSNTYSNAYSGSTNISAPFGIGTNAGSVGNGANQGQFKGIHFLVFPGSGIPLNIGLVAQKLAASPGMYLTNADFKF